MKISPKCPRPKGGKDGQWWKRRLSRKGSYHIKIDYEMGVQEARVSAVL